MSVRLGKQLIAGSMNLDNKQDVSTAVNYNNISNCITEIPQDIKLELNDGTLTLKAGSKVYVPNRFEVDGTTPKFDVKIIESDIIVESLYTDGPMFIYYVDNTVVPVPSSWSISGTSNTIIDGYSCWYDTTNNIIKIIAGDEVGYSGMSLPLAIVNGSSNGDWTSIDQVFNGFGYMGSTIYALPGVKGLIPNGRNADGSLKNIEVIINDVKIISDNAASKLLLMKASGDLEYAYGNFYIRDSLPVASSSYERCFVVPENQMYYHDTVSTIWSKRNYTIVGNMNKNYTENITSFMPKTVFHALDYNDKSTISGWSMPSSRYIDLTLGASGSKYIAPANGILALRGQTTSTNKAYGITNNANGCVNLIRVDNLGNDFGVFMLAQKGQSLTVTYEGSLASGYVFRFIYAEGEAN